RIKLLLLPPRSFVAAPVKLAMMQPAQRHGELVAHLSSHRLPVGKLDVVGIARRAATNQAGLRADKFEMLLVTTAQPLGQRQRRLLFHGWSNGALGLGQDTSG